MLDPFFPPPAALVEAFQPVAEFLGLSTLPLHIHEAFLAWAFYQIVFSLLSPRISAWLLPSFYRGLSSRTKITWNVRVTSFIQSSFIVLLALFVIRGDAERREMDWVGRIWGYTGAGGFVQACAAGYFAWDLIASILYLKVLGWGSLAHAISALLVTSLGFRPFANYYGLNFILYEISTPFLNIHWVLDKLNMTGSRLQLYNGVALLMTFFGGRVVWGNYQSLRIYSDIWTALYNPSSEHQLLKREYSHDYGVGVGLGLDVKDQINTLPLPMWLVIVYLGSNTILNLLNIFWFTKMIQALRKRF